ncbi:hypothetical protein, partial [Mycoplasmopsis cynos]
MSKRVIQLILKNEAMSFVSDIKHKSYSAENLTKLEMLTQKVLKQIQEEDNKIKNDIKNYTQGEEKNRLLEKLKRAISADERLKIQNDSKKTLNLEKELALKNIQKLSDYNQEKTQLINKVKSSNSIDEVKKLSSNAEEKLNVIQKETEKLLDKLKGSDQYQSILSSIKSYETTEKDFENIKVKINEEFNKENIKVSEKLSLLDNKNPEKSKLRSELDKANDIESLNELINKI